MMNKSLLKSFIHVFLITGIAFCLPASVTAQDYKQQADAIFDPLEDPDAPGAAILITHDGETRYERYYGSAHLEYDVPIGPKSVFHVASVTKQFTAYAILWLAQKGLVDLEANIRTYLPEMPEYEEVIRVRHLLYHTSGLRSENRLAFVAGWRWNDIISKQDFRSLHQSQKALNHPPGEEVSYTNSGYFLLADIIKAVTGKSQEEWSREHIFAPLGMKNTGFHNEYYQLKENAAYPFGKTEDGWEHSSLPVATSGSGNLRTTARDLTKWLTHLDSLQTRKPELWEALTAVGTLNDGSPTIYPGVGVKMAAGLAWTPFTDARTVGFAGGYENIRAVVSIIPEHHVTGVILANTSHSHSTGMLFSRLNRLFNITLKHFEDIELPETEKNEKKDASFDGEIDGDLMKKATGTYYIARSKVPSSIAPTDLQNYPESVPFVLRKSGEAYQTSVDGQNWEEVTPSSRSRLRLNGQVEIDIASDSPHLVFGEEKVPLEPATCSAADLASRLTGVYQSSELFAQYKISATGGKLYVKHHKHPRAELTCVRPDLYVAPAKDISYRSDIDFPGFKHLETVLDDEDRVTAIEISFDPRLRRMRFDRVE